MPILKLFDPPQKNEMARHTTALKIICGLEYYVSIVNRSNKIVLFILTNNNQKQSKPE